MGIDRDWRAAPRGRSSSRGLRPAPIELEFRGRTEQLGRMQAALRAVARGHPVRQLIIGEQGIGKSRLVAEALSGNVREGLVLHTARAVELHSDRPFGALIEALDLRGDAGHAANAAIAALIKSAMRRTGDAEQREEVVGRIVESVKRVTDTAPMALVLEDVQWADRFTVLTLTRLGRECADRPLGVFLTRRVLPFDAPIDELLDDGGPALECIDLEALDTEVIALLAHDFLGAAPGPRLQRQIDDAGGNPALLLAMLNGWQRAGELHGDSNVIDTTMGEPPQEMRPAVLARIARLTDRCQDLLTVASVFERPFAVAILAAIARRSLVDVLADLREGIAARLLLEVAGLLNFRHEVVRQIIYEATPVPVRAALHREISDALSADRGSRELIGHHQLRAAELSGGPTAAMWPVDSTQRAQLRWELLTKAEREVALLVARGLSNKQAGARLQISARTVETHLAHVFAKLGINSRVELAAAVGRAGSKALR